MGSKMKKNNLEKLKKATEKALRKQDEEATSSRLNKLSSILGRLAADKDPISIDELGPSKDPLQLSKYFKK